MFVWKYISGFPKPRPVMGTRSWVSVEPNAKPVSKLLSHVAAGPSLPTDQ